MSKNLRTAVVIAIGLVVLSGCLEPAANQASTAATELAGEAAVDQPAFTAVPAAAQQTASSSPTVSPSPAVVIEPTATRTPTYRRKTFVLSAGSLTETPPPTEASKATTEGLGFTIAFIDVGQGDATLVIANNGETLLIDGGRSKERIRDRLDRLGVGDLDAVAATHPDADHIAGLLEALDLFVVERIYLNGGTSASQTFADLLAAIELELSAVTVLASGDTIPLGDLEITVLHPNTLTGDSNVDSLVIQISCGTVEVLLTGDAEVPSENAMLNAGTLSDVDVLKAGHHGSNTSNSVAFLDVVKPEVVVISAGLDNQYGHPHQEVIDRFAALGASVIRTDTTDEDDTVIMTSDCSTYGFSSGAAPTEETTQRPTPTPPEPTGTPIAQATASVSESCGGATAQIVGLDKTGKPEIVTISGNGVLTGWSIFSVRGQQQYEFPDGFVLNTTVEIHSVTPQFEDSSSKVHWSASAIWNNTEDDDAELYDCDGLLVSTFDDGE